MPPITVVFVITGLAVWVIGLAFLGVGARQTEGQPNPLVTVGWIALAAGIVDLVNALWIIEKLFGGDASDTGVRLGGLATFYGLFFLAVGTALVKGLDLKPVANLAVGVALTPLAWWTFFDGTWMFQSILIVWAIAFLSVAAFVYGKLRPPVLGGVLVVTAIYTFLLPAALLGAGQAIP
ncbi:MAG TPA: hypothetical protein VGG75_19500 [Trebonia sp.]